MNAVDFEYDGRRLSDFGFIICRFDGDGGLETENAGAELTFNTVSRHRGKKYTLISSRYDACITATFQVCKDPCRYNDSQMAVTSEEYRSLAKWLNRGSFRQLRFYYDDGDTTRPVCYYNAGFNIARIMVGDRLFGLELTMETDSPFGYGATVTQTQQITEDTSDLIFPGPALYPSSAVYPASSANASFTVSYTSDEIGYIYPDVTIVCGAPGEFMISNTLTGSVTKITGCTSGEVITMDGGAMTISSSLSSHDIANSFNFQFLRLGNTPLTSDNTIIVSNLCTIQISYAPILRAYA